MSPANLEIKVNRIHRLTNTNALKAFADIAVNDALLIKGIRVLDGKQGHFIAMPREQSAKDKKWYEVVRCLSFPVKERITEEVLKAYHADGG